MYIKKLLLCRVFQSWMRVGVDRHTGNGKTEKVTGTTGKIASRSLGQLRVPFLGSDPAEDGEPSCE